MLGVRYGGRVRDRIERSRLRNWLLRVMRVEQTACVAAVWLRPSQTVLAWAGSLRLSNAGDRPVALELAPQVPSPIRVFSRELSARGALAWFVERRL